MVGLRLSTERWYELNPDDLIFYAPYGPHDHFTPHAEAHNEWFNIVWINYLTTEAWIWVWEAKCSRFMWVSDSPFSNEKRRCLELRSIEGYE
jgi:hypothetical protein